MERDQHAVVNFLSHLGQVWGYASHKPELLTTNLMVSLGNVPPLGTKWYPLPLITLIFSSVNIEQHECCVNFWDFRGLFGHFYALTEFSMNLCAYFKFELHAHAQVYINWLKNQIFVLGCMLRSYGRNGNECQTPCHRHSAANIEIPRF